MQRHAVVDRRVDKPRARKKQMHKKKRTTNKTSLKILLESLEMLRMWLERVDWDGLVTWREKMRKTGYKIGG